jgi:predicted DNA-binding antitoxin AbrB/MazE fold protein
MSDEEKDKGFRVIDRRGGDAPSEAPPVGENPNASKTTGNSQGAPGVKEENKSGGKVGGEKMVPKFLDLVESLQMGVMANLGMLQLSEGKRTPVNLREAQNIIDILDILQEKTRGNLEEDEERVLRDGLTQLRLAFIAVQKQTIPDLGGGR